MKKGYFKGLNKSFGIFPIIILALAFFGVFFVSRGSVFPAESEIIKDVITTGGYALFIAIALVGFAGLRDEKINFIDIIRPSGILSGIAAAICAIVLDKNLVGLIIYAVASVLLVIQLIIRIIQGEFEIGVSGFKAYFSKVASMFNPIYTLLIAAGLTIAIYVCRSYIIDGSLNIDSYIIKYSAAVGIGLIVTALVLALMGSKKTNVIDVLFQIVFTTSLLSLVYAVFSISVFKPVSILCVLSLGAILLRGASYSCDNKNIKGIKFNRYFTDLFSKIDLTLIFTCAFVTVMLFIIPSFKDLSLITQTINVPEINFSDNFVIILGYISVGIVVLDVLLLFVFRNITNPEIRPIDFLVSILFYVGMFALPIIGWFILESTKFSANILINNVNYLVVVCVLAFALILGVILTIVRINYYQGLEAQVEAFEQARRESLEENVEDNNEEQVNDEEQSEPVEEVQEEANDAEPEEVVENTAEPEEQVVYVDEEGNEVEAPANTEDVPEEVVYVDEEGNEVEAPANTEDVPEEVVYVDEEGNEVEAPANTEDVPEEVVYVDENGNEVEAPSDDDDYEEEVVYIDEDGNEISPDELADAEIVEETEPEYIDEELDDDVDEDDDEEDEESGNDTSEDDEFEAAIAAISEAPANKPSIVVEDIRPVDEEGNVKKIKRKFNARMMYASEAAKEYYNEIKNYLVMYRAKGRYSSRCETFRYKGLVAKVALAGKSIKVCLAIDPTSLVDTKYHFKDVSSKKQYAEVPTMIKVRSARGLKHFQELVDMMMSARGVKVKRNFERTDYTKNLIPNGEAILGTLGYSVDYLYNVMNVESIPSELPDDLEMYLPKVIGDDLEEKVEAPIYLDTLCKHFVDGDEITIDVLKTLHVVTKGNALRIKARGTLDRKLTIYADTFEPDAVKMLLCTNCTAVKIVRPSELKDEE